LEGLSAEAITEKECSLKRLDGGLGIVIVGSVGPVRGEKVGAESDGVATAVEEPLLGLETLLPP